MRVLYSFPHKLGADRICYTAWEQVRGLSKAGVRVLAMPGALSRRVSDDVEVRPTLSLGKLRIPYKVIGTVRALRLHDWVISRRLEQLVGKIDLVHCWPTGSLQTLETAKRLGIPTVLERPNAHTRFCYDVLEAECKRVGVSPHHEYQRRESILLREEAEFEAADKLLCPSEFSAQSFIDKGFPESKILRHQYGYDETMFFPEPGDRDPNKKFTAIFVGVDAVRKGLHFALQAWLESSAAMDGLFWIAGELNEEFKTRFAKLLAHRSVIQLGHRRDVPQLMRQADVMVLPSLEEGFGLVCVEAIGSGCVPLVSTACTEMCRHMENSFVHDVGEGGVAMLREYFETLHSRPESLARLRAGCLKSRLDLTWTKAGERLAAAYEQAVMCAVHQ